MNHTRVLSVACCAILAASAAPAVGPGIAKQLSRELADTVEKVMPSVVVVRTEATRYYRAYDAFFGRRFMIPQVQAGQGSGMILDAEGHILTSRHVVAGAQDIVVVLNDETQMKARVIGMDPTTDLAVLRVENPSKLKLTPIALGDSAATRIGELVIAVGSPFSLASSVTMGVVSQKGRSVGVLPFEDFIQTDAPINPGNSGGPLVDLDGRLVGVNAVIQTSGASQGNIGIGFAVPVNLARRVAESIIKNGRFERPWLGIAWGEARGQPDPGSPRGILIAEVYRGTPAAKAGLKPGDILIRAAGIPLNSSHDLQRAIISKAIGERIDLEVSRDSKILTMSVPTAKMPAVDEIEME